ncbi:hypothetical protein KC19_4G100300 [Ceratodon purpureus]|uniref:Protein kinase domain-containing protein n=1 Tax=Ceratodon purpureus TaxID=3225 RepID=A0A8T0I7I0_CERPU|nr:hypothetical protein KC19_4G100300 [Ceratodon purpureus]
MAFPSWLLRFFSKPAACGNERECCMVMELMDGYLFNTMQKLLAEDKTLCFKLEEVWNTFMRIVHRDLKAMNILVKFVKAGEFESKKEYILAELTDFGLSRIR